MATSSRPPRELRAVLFVDLVDSTRRLVDLGDAAWTDVLDDFDAASREVVEQHHGRVANRTGDGFLAVLPTPSAAIDAATALHDLVAKRGLGLRAGVHVGEIQERGGDVAGAAIHLASRLERLGAPGETIVSSAAALLTPATDRRLVSRGTVELKGFTEPVSVFVVPASSPAPVAPTSPGSTISELLAGSHYARVGERLVDLDPDGLLDTADRVISASGRAEYLGVDLALVRLVEDLLERLPANDDLRRSRLSAKLAFELRGDPTSLDERRALLAEATARAERSGDVAARVDALLSQVHALWEPAGMQDRLEATELAIAVARRARLVERELDARIARVDVLLGLGRLVDAELELTTFTRLASPDDPARQVFAATRRASILMVRGMFDAAEREAAAAETHARVAGLPDADRLILALGSTLVLERGDVARIKAWGEENFPHLEAQIRRLPGHHLECHATYLLFRLGRHREARVELTRALASLRRHKGVRWLISAYFVAPVVAALGTDDERSWLLDALERDTADFATLNFSFAGSTHAARGMLAASLGRPEEAQGHYDRAVADLDAVGALPGAARARAARAAVRRALDDEAGASADETAAREVAVVLDLADLLPAAAIEPETGRVVWRLDREPSGWHLVAGSEDVRFRPARGFDHLRVLLTNPGQEVSAVALESDGAIADGPRSGPTVLDDAARAAYQARLRELDEALDAADARSDAASARKLATERDTLIAELRRASGLGGRTRRASDATERSRINVTRNVRRTIEQITVVAPTVGLHLAASVRTGTVCRYEPAPGGPDSWRCD